MNARKSMLVCSSQLIIAILGWIGLVVLAKMWGSYAPEALGIIGYALAFVGLFGALADIGFSQAHVKRISEGKDLGTCIGTFIFIKGLLIILMVSSILLTVFVDKDKKYHSSECVIIYSSEKLLNKRSRKKNIKYIIPEVYNFKCRTELELISVNAIMRHLGIRL